MRPINLLPRATKRRRKGLGGTVLLTFLVLLVLGGFAAGVYWMEERLSVARDDFAAQTLINQDLERQISELAPAAAMRANYQARADHVRNALADEVDFGLFLNDLSHLLPPRTWLNTFSGSIGGGGSAGALGRVSFSGEGVDFNDVADWVRALDADLFRRATGPWVSSVERITYPPMIDMGVRFQSTATLTPDAASGRAERIIPVVP